MPSRKPYLASFALVLVLAMGPLAALAGYGVGLGVLGPLLVVGLGLFALWSSFAADGS